MQEGGNKDYLPKLLISSLVVQRLGKINADHHHTGTLYGVTHDKTLFILGFTINDREKYGDDDYYEKIQIGMPAGLNVCGLFKIGADDDDVGHDIIRSLDHYKTKGIIQHTPVYLFQDSKKQSLNASLCMGSTVKSIPFDVLTEPELYNTCIHTRLLCDLFIVSSADQPSIKTSMDNLRKSVDSVKTGFNIKNTKIYLICTEEEGTTNDVIEQNVIGIDPQTKVTDLINISIDNNDDDDDSNDGNGESLSKINKTTNNKTKNSTTMTKSSSSTSSSSSSYKRNIINVTMIENRTNDKLMKENKSVDSVQGSIPNDSTLLRIPIPVDALAIVHKDNTVNDLYSILIKCLNRILTIMETGLIRQIERATRAAGELSALKIHHFFPNECGHFFTIGYPMNVKDDDDFLKTQRKEYHSQLDLPIKRSYFRRSNVYQFKEEQSDDIDDDNSLLINPHKGIRFQPDNIHLVQGNYSYYHYMQQNFNDNGWGCAYRSLQTICSWFRHQGYSDHKIPTHLEIQKYLVDIGDKPNAFINSKQWIGSTEVSMCLNGFFNVVSRILHCDSGSELADLGPTLAHHFKIHGTPIMIGGGVLAHTILGVKFDGDAMDLKFLILDPHYTGADDLQTVLAKGWCGWKGCDFWNKKSYYNLCMPQLPKECY